MAADKAKSETNETGSGGVMAIRLVLTILEQLAKQDNVGVTELSKSLGTTKARVFRHLRTLVDQGYAQQNEGTERYSAGPQLIALSRIAALSPDEGLIRLARPTMMHLREEFGHGVNLSLVYGDSASIVDTLPGKSFVGVVMRTHMPMPLHTTAAGKLLLADILARDLPLPNTDAPLEKFTDNSITDPESLRSELERISSQGWAAAPEETVLGINAISAPIMDHNGVLVAMISIVSSIQFVPRQPSREMIEAVKAAASQISAQLSLG